MKKQKSGQMFHQKRRESDAVGSICSQFMSIDTILEQLSSVKGTVALLQMPRDGPESAQNRIAACEAATAILSTLQDEGIKDSEEIKDLIYDYNTQAKQYQTMHQKYEMPAKPRNFGGVWLCPDCSRQMRPGNNFCWNCGKRLGW